MLAQKEIMDQWNRIESRNKPTLTQSVIKEVRIDNGENANSSILLEREVKGEGRTREGGRKEGRQEGRTDRLKLK